MYSVIYASDMDVIVLGVYQYVVYFMKITSSRTLISTILYCIDG